MVAWEPGTTTARRRAHAGAKHRARLWWAAGLLAAFMVVEAVAALLTGSLALLSDAGHMFTDVLGIAMALAAITRGRPGGHRLAAHLRALPARGARRAGQRACCSPASRCTW